VLQETVIDGTIWCTVQFKMAEILYVQVHQHGADMTEANGWQMGS
jgi:hypothetical protein